LVEAPAGPYSCFPGFGTNLPAFQFDRMGEAAVASIRGTKPNPWYPAWYGRSRTPETSHYQAYLAVPRSRAVIRCCR